MEGWEHPRNSTSLLKPKVDGHTWLCTYQNYYGNLYIIKSTSVRNIYVNVWCRDLEA